MIINLTKFLPTCASTHGMPFPMWARSTEIVSYRQRCNVPRRYWTISLSSHPFRHHLCLRRPTARQVWLSLSRLRLQNSATRYRCHSCRRDRPGHRMSSLPSLFISPAVIQDGKFVLTLTHWFFFDGSTHRPEDHNHVRSSFLSPSTSPVINMNALAVEGIWVHCFLDGFQDHTASGQAPHNGVTAESTFFSKAPISQAAPWGRRLPS